MYSWQQPAADWQPHEQPVGDSEPRGYAPDYEYQQWEQQQWPAEDDEDENANAFELCSQREEQWQDPSAEQEQWQGREHSTQWTQQQQLGHPGYTFAGSMDTSTGLRSRVHVSTSQLAAALSRAGGPGDGSAFEPPLERNTPAAATAASGYLDVVRRKKGRLRLWLPQATWDSWEQQQQPLRGYPGSQWPAGREEPVNGPNPAVAPAWTPWEEQQHGKQSAPGRGLRNGPPQPQAFEDRIGPFAQFDSGWDSSRNRLARDVAGPRSDLRGSDLTPQQQQRSQPLRPAQRVEPRIRASRTRAFDQLWSGATATTRQTQHHPNQGAEDLFGNW